MAMANSLDVTLRLSEQSGDKSSFTRAIDQSIERYGCAVVVDPGIDVGAIDEAFAVVEDLVAARSRPESASDFAEAELWTSGRPTTAKTGIATLAEAMERLGGRALSGIAAFLWLGSDWFDAGVSGGVRSLRAVKLDHADEADAASEISGPSDVVSLTVCNLDLNVSVRDRAGEWRSVDLPKGAVLLAVGTMLQRLTNNILPATSFRLATSDDRERAGPRYAVRYRIPFRDGFEIRSLPECVSSETWPDRYPEGMIVSASTDRRDA